MKGNSPFISVPQDTILFGASSQIGREEVAALSAFYLAIILSTKVSFNLYFLVPFFICRFLSLFKTGKMGRKVVSVLSPLFFAFFLCSKLPRRFASFVNRRSFKGKAAL